MMSKGEIDDFFSNKKNVTEIKRYVNHTFNKKTGGWKEKDYLVFFISEIYLHIIGKYLGNIEDEKHLKKIISNYIYNSSNWHKGKSNLQSEMNSRETLIETYESFENQEVEYDLIDKIDDEVNLNSYRAVCEAYYNTLQSLEKKVVYEVFFDEGQNSIRKFSAYCGISKWSAQQYIQTMKSEIKEFYELNLDKKGKNDIIY